MVAIFADKLITYSISMSNMNIRRLLEQLFKRDNLTNFQINLLWRFQKSFEFERYVVCKFVLGKTKVR